MNLMKDLQLVLLNEKAKMPMRSTKGSAGYDVFAHQQFVLPKGETLQLTLPFTFEGKLDGNVQVRTFVRSSFGIKKKVRLVENNKKNIQGITLNLLEKNHVIALLNDSQEDITIAEGEHFAQFIISEKEPKKEKQVVEKLTKDELGDSIPTNGHMEVMEPNVFAYVLDEELVLSPYQQVTIATGYRSVIEQGTWTGISVTKELEDTLMLANQTPVVDADYAYNESTKGNVFLGLVNLKDEKVVIPAGTPLTLWYTEKYYILEDEIKTDKVRTGGVGHTSN